MRVAYVTETYPPELNGVASTTCRAVAALRERGHEVRVVRPRQPGHDDPPLRIAQTTDMLTRGLPIPMYPQLRFGLARPARLARSWRALRPELVHVATPGPLGLAAAIAGRRMGAAVTIDFRTHFHRYCEHYHLGFASSAVRGYLRWLHGHAHRSFVPTDEARDELARQGFERLAVSGRGVDTEFFTPELRHPELRLAWDAARPGQVVMLYVGRLAPEKQPEVALQAYRRVLRARPDTRMVVVGDGPLRARLQAEYPQAFFLGVRTGTELACCYASADVFLFPSLTDTFGNVTLEALASGLVVVAYDTAAARQHLRHGADALLCPREEGAQGFAQRATRATLLALEPSPMRFEARRTALTLRWQPVLRSFIEQLEAVEREVHEGLLRDAALA